MYIYNGAPSIHEAVVYRNDLHAYSGAGSGRLRRGKHTKRETERFVNVIHFILAEESYQDPSQEESKPHEFRRET